MRLAYECKKDAAVRGNRAKLFVGSHATGANTRNERRRRRRDGAILRANFMFRKQTTLAEPTPLTLACENDQRFPVHLLSSSPFVFVLPNTVVQTFNAFAVSTIRIFTSRVASFFFEKYFALRNFARAFWDTLRPVGNDRGNPLKTFPLVFASGLRDDRWARVFPVSQKVSHGERFFFALSIRPIWRNLKFTLELIKFISEICR